MGLRLSFVSLMACACACATGGSGDGAVAPVDGAAEAPDAAKDALRSDGPASCTLGTADDCGSCGTSCGTSDKASLFACTDATAAGTCTLTCRGEHYDLDGKIENGCEAEDPVVQDTAANAVGITLPDTNDATNTSNPLNKIGYVYGDGRPHEDPPTSRPLGREDWYHVTAVGAGVANSTMGACLGITNFPTDDVFEVCITDVGGTTFPAASCKTVKGTATSVCVAPANNADAGQYYVRVRKTDGSNTANGYALFLEH